MFRFVNVRGKDKSSRGGFTLIELAIVLGVSSVLFVGLWRLMATGNTQLRDQTVAEQHKQLIEATTRYLTDTTAFWAGVPASPGISSFAPAALGGHLPSGFSNLNSYGQSYTIYVRRDDGSTPPAVSARYSFMIATAGGETIADVSGGRIASLIGGDGGFVYSDNVCGANFVCGAYNGWSLDPSTNYVLAPIASGHIASRTFVSTGAQSSSPWLARFQLPGTDMGGGITDPNTIQTDVSLNDNTLFGNGDITVPGGSIENLKFLEVRMPSKIGDNPITFSRNTCNDTDIYETEGGAFTCDYTLRVNGGQLVFGFLGAKRLYAESFLYGTVSAPSDKRLKHDIKPIENALEKIASLHGYSFFLENEKKRKYGVIAQDVEKAFPEVVVHLGKKSNHTDRLGVDYLGLIGPLVAAVRELKEENERLREDLSAIKKAFEQTQVSKEADAK